VLVTGLNGIRKTTSIYEPWFKRALHAALQPSASSSVGSDGKSSASSSSTPPATKKQKVVDGTGAAGAGAAVEVTNISAVDDLPDGTTAFFRQLDYMIASVANEDFKALYTAGHDVAEYSQQKAGIFTKYRMVAEMLGVLLMKAAQVKAMVRCASST
jgi:hypothetical protein